MQKLTIYLKSGGAFSVYAKRFQAEDDDGAVFALTTKYYTTPGNVTQLVIPTPIGAQLVLLDMDAVAAITVERVEQPD